VSRYVFALATADDDAQLRDRMARDWMEGEISVSFRREPNYFLGCQVQGRSFQVIKCTDTHTGQIVGLGSRLTARVWINGTVRRCGYLADLRIHPAYRRGTIVARGYRFLRQLHDADPVSLYYSLILDGNRNALENLVGGRAGLPEYRDVGFIQTPAIYLDLPKPEIRISGVQFERGSWQNLAKILDFVRLEQGKKQFAPCYFVEDFQTNRLRGLNPEDFYLAVRKNEIVGAIAAWDRRSFSQTHVEKYSRALGTMRPFYNAIARLTPLRPLPEPGAAVPCFYVGFVAIRDNDPQIFRALLRHLYRDRRRGEWHYFIVGLHEGDPLAEVLGDYRRIDAGGHLFVLHYREDRAAFDRLDGRVPYLEMATI
jgi:hypothetical protein